MSSAGVTCLYAEIGRSGTGGAAYKTNSEAQTACATLNGSQFEGVTLQCEMWGAKKPAWEDSRKIAVPCEHQYLMMKKRNSALAAVRVRIEIGYNMVWSLIELLQSENEKKLIHIDSQTLD